MSTLSENHTRKCLEMRSSGGNTPERTHKDGYENHAPRGATEMREFIDATTRRVWIERLRESIHRADHGVIG